MSVAEPSLSARIEQVLASIPAGRVTSYGRVAMLAGNPRAARQVVRVLNARSRAASLPWHRVLGAAGDIRLPRGGPFEEQAALLDAEGIDVDAQGRVDFARFGWP